MRTERNLKILAIVAITLAVGGLSVGFAAFSRTLEITNAAVNVDPASFGIEFTSLALTAEGDATGNEPALAPAATTVTGIQVGFSKPGDKVTYDFVVTNTGNLDAELKSFTDFTLPATIDAITCSVAGDETNVSAVNVCGNILYTFTYTDGSAFAVDDLLAGGTTANVRLTIEYDPTTPEGELPVAVVNITGITAALNYETN